MEDQLSAPEITKDLIQALKLLKQADTMLVDSFKAFGTYNKYNVRSLHSEAKELLNKYPNIK